VEEFDMKPLKGWKSLSHDRGYMNEVTGQTLVVKKKEFVEHFVVWLFPGETYDDSQGRKISPEFAARTKADAFASDWMQKNPNGTP
jgi:hypothetical protein